MCTRRRWEICSQFHQNLEFQILCLAEQIRFTRDCELAIGNNSLTGLRASLATQLETYTTAKPADNVLSLKLKALILDIIHHIDVVDKLMAVRF